MRTIILASLALVTLTGCSGAPASSGDAEEVPVPTSHLGTESFNELTRSFGYLEPNGWPSYTVDIQGGGEFGWVQTDTTNFWIDAPNQMFTIGPNHSILSMAGSCLDVPNSNDVDGQQVYANGCNGQPNQAWYFYSATMSTAGKCLYHDGENPGTAVQIEPCGTNPYERWWLTYDAYDQSQTPDAFEIQDVSRGRCLSTDGNGLVVLEECIGNVYETWMHGANGSFWNVYTGTCITAGSSMNGTYLTASPCTGATNQQFAVTGELRSGIDLTKCLDVRGGSSGPGVAVQIYGCNGGSNQFFTMYQ